MCRTVREFQFMRSKSRLHCIHFTRSRRLTGRPEAGNLSPAVKRVGYPRQYVFHRRRLEPVGRKELSDVSSEKATC